VADGRVYVAGLVVSRGAKAPSQPVSAGSWVDGAWWAATTPTSNVDETAP